MQGNISSLYILITINKLSEYRNNKYQYNRLTVQIKGNENALKMYKTIIMACS